MKTTKRILSMLLALAVVLSFCAVPAFADDGTVSGNEASVTTSDKVTTEYATAQEAILAAETTTGNTVKLLKDIDIIETGLVFDSNTARTVTFDLNGHSIKTANTAKANISLQNRITVNLVDNSENNTGKIYSDTPYISGTQDKPVIVLHNGAILNMKGGTINTVYSADPAKNGNFAIGVYKNGTCNISGGKIEAGWYCVASNGGGVTYSGAKINITGGDLNSVADYAVYAPSTSGSVTVSGGTITGATGGVLMNNGTLTIKGGKFVSKGTGNTGDAGDGTSGTKNAAVNVNAKYGKVTATITGGEFVAEGNATSVTKSSENTCTLAISGGTFSDDVNKEYFKDNFYYTEKDENGNYTVKRGNEASINGVGYQTLSKAVSAASAGDTIELLGDITISSAITLKKDVTIEGNGYTVYGKVSSALKFPNKTTTGTNFTFKNLKLSTNVGKILDIEKSGSTVTIDNVEVVNGPTLAYTIRCAGLKSTVNIKNSKILNDVKVESDYANIILAKSVTVNIENSEINVLYVPENPNGTPTINIFGDGNKINNLHCLNYVPTITIEGGTIGEISGTGKYIIKGGVFESDIAAAEDNYSKITISGGTFTNDVSDYVVDGLTANKNADGSFTVGEKQEEVKKFDKIVVLRGTTPWLFAAVDTLDYNEAGFVLKLDTETEGTSTPATIVCTSVESSGKTVQASELGGNYLFGVQLGEKYKDAFSATPFADENVGSATYFAAATSSAASSDAE